MDDLKTPAIVANVDREKNVVYVGKKVISLGGISPTIKEGERVIRYTSSLCPYCFRPLPAIIIERENRLYIRRHCPEHGEIEEVYFEDAEMYRKFERYGFEGVGPGYVYTAATAPCPFNCGLCPLHKSHTALLNVVATNRCDLSCWYCFYYAEKAGYVYEPTIDDIKKMVEAVKKQPNIVVAVQLTGGEPTLRDDLEDIVETLRKMGVRHIQLNTHGIKFARLYLANPEEAIKYTKRLRDAGVNTVYLSFDGVTPETNPKNHWEVPYTLEVFRNSGMTSVVFVPTVIKSVNDHELGDIVKIAAYNMDVVRAVNFQPVSLVGMMRKQDRNRYRITIPEVIRKLEEQLNGEITKNDWFPVGAAVPIARFLELLDPSKKAEFTTHPACGAATYVYVKRVNDSIEFVPITRFIDAEGLLDYLEKKYESLKTKPAFLTKILGATSILSILNKFVLWDKVPDEIKKEFRSILLDIFIHRNYEALGKFHYKFLFIGMMHFMDEWNYDVERVMRCVIHYALPDGRIIPFCAFNILNDIYRDTPQKTYGIPIEEYIKKYGEKVLQEQKYVRTKDLIEKMINGEPYKKFYRPVMDKLKEFYTIS
ncbi:radical SAM protein [Ignisphaera sp. 4213-co]|uniref:Radical SAM protein n=1 Tax=Ignisphaera cupida TaxID=3050454 RepID=A0ABD4Z8U8_9CREN|nr:radical SAM protein [Ignisphaera sp. 4213-co]MDK6029325.1 radical SAM protein [Ignisphaera sp. 4213-co]